MNQENRNEIYKTLIRHKLQVEESKETKRIKLLNKLPEGKLVTGKIRSIKGMPGKFKKKEGRRESNESGKKPG